MKGFSRKKAMILLALLLGVVLGLGTYTFYYAKGFSYLSNSPEACKNCHVMNEVYEGWMKGGHQHVAVCNDCHVPQGVVAKYAVKAMNGFHHSWAFTFTDVPIAIQAKPFSKAIVQSNCERCHVDMAHAPAHGPSGSAEPLKCVSCHMEAGHKH